MNVGVLYKIQDNLNPDLVYYGSSELSLDERIKKHIYDFNYWKNTGKNYCSSYRVLELGNWKPTLLKIVFFTIKWELWEHERKLIESNECCNHNIPNRTKAEYREDNKKHIKEQKADYYQENKEHIKKQVADYKLKNKDKINKKFACGCGGKYSHQYKSTHEKTQIHQNWLKL